MNACRLGHGHRAGSTDQVGSLSAGGEGDEGHLDIVNPYFRTADFSELFGSLGIKLVAPQFANTNLDIPSLGFDMAAVINGCDRLIIDVGGDDTGAVALGQYATVLGNFGCELYYVVNRYRYLTRTPGEAVELLHDIEQVSRIRAKGIVNCSNLGSQTTADDVKVTADYALKCASEAGVPLALTAAERSLGVEGAYPVDVYVRPFWEE